MGYRFDGLNRIGSVIGKEVENFKVQVKRLQKDYERIIDKGCKNEVDKFILREGNKMLTKGLEAIEYIYRQDYFGIIKRSMNREEICIGRVDQGNLHEENGIFKIGTIKYLTYNLVEEDLYKYIKKLQRKQLNINENEIIKAFVYRSHLSINSFHYLQGLCSYPKDFFKVWERYRENKKGKTNEEFLEEMKKTIDYEGKKLIN